MAEEKQTDGKQEAEAPEAVEETAAEATPPVEEAAA